MIILTLDLDWAPDYILDYCFSQLLESGLKVTLFATHKSPAIENVASRFKIGLHPNISGIENAEAVISELKNTFPQSKSIRNHSLTNSSRFLGIYKKHGLVCTSNYMMISQDNIVPIPLLYGISEFPIYYMDDIHFRINPDFKPEPLIDKLIKGKGLKVLDFHPVHIYLNSDGLERYQSLKHVLNDKERVDACINKGKGIGDIFRSLIADSRVKERAVGFGEGIQRQDHG